MRRLFGAATTRKTQTGSVYTKRSQYHAIPPAVRFDQDGFGFLIDIDSRLITKKNGSVIKICGHQFEGIKWALTTWVQPIPRVFKYQKSCDGADIYSYNRSDSEIINMVKKWKDHVDLSARAFVYTDPSQGLQLFNPTHVPLLKNTLLYEAGHLMGLCDQYRSEIMSCARTSQPVENSVMATARSDTLQEDDIEGIKNLALDYLQSNKMKAALSTKEKEYFAKGRNFYFCSQVKDKVNCLYQKCLWDQKSGCLSY